MPIRLRNFIVEAPAWLVEPGQLLNSYVPKLDRLIVPIYYHQFDGDTAELEIIDDYSAALSAFQC